MFGEQGGLQECKGNFFFESWAGWAIFFSWVPKKKGIFFLRVTKGCGLHSLALVMPSTPSPYRFIGVGLTPPSTCQN